MNKERLTILRDALIEHAKNPGNLKFDLRSWAHVPHKYEGRKKEAVEKARLGENFCGTTACACGLATTIPAFKEAGLHLEWSFGAADVVMADGSYIDGSFFGIEEKDFDELFVPDAYLRKDWKNPLAVADKITALLETA